MNALAEWRNRLLAHPGFRRWAQRLPGLRGITRRRARDLFNITSGFVNSQVLAACLELDLFKQLAGGSQDMETLAARNRADAGAHAAAVAGGRVAGSCWNSAMVAATGLGRRALF